MDRELAYYRGRIEQELSAAEQANSARARAAHRELAELYAARLDLLDARSPWQGPASERPVGGRLLLV